MVIRRITVSLSLLALLGITAGLGANRDRPHMAVDVAADPTTDEPTNETTSAPAEDGNGKASSDDQPAPDGADAQPRDPVHLTVIAGSWEIVAPGVVANHGMAAGPDSAFTAAKVQAVFDVTDNPADIERKLGLGGDAVGGADIALMPLPAFVASYERLRALSPQVFFVVGWSRGRDALTGDVALVNAPPRKGNVTLRGRPGSAESSLGLFALDWAGVDGNRVDVVGRTGPQPKRSIEALRRRKSRQVDAREVFLSTADATHLIPIVAVAPKSVLTNKRAAVADWARVWLRGTETLATDPAQAARALAAEPKSPDAVDLIDALGWVTFADLRGAAASVGLSGRRAATVEQLFERTWQLWRASGLLATPPPERMPLNAVIIAQLASESKVSVVAPPAATRPAAREGSEPVLVHRIKGSKLSAADESGLVAEAGFIADVFSRSQVRITVSRDPQAAQRIATSAAERFDLHPDRFVVVMQRKRIRGVAGQLEVLPPA